MELEHLGGSGVKPDRGNARLYRIALAMCVSLCAILLLALILGKSTKTHTHTHVFFTHGALQFVRKSAEKEMMYSRHTVLRL